MPKAEDVFPVLGECIEEEDMLLCGGQVVEAWYHHMTPRSYGYEDVALCTRCGTVDGAYEVAD